MGDFYVEEGGYIKSAPESQLQEIFEKYASAETMDGYVMTPEDFVRKFLGLFPEDDYNEESVKLLASIVDIDKNGHISFDEFKYFENLLCLPDALYKITFNLFDVKGRGLIDFSDFIEIMHKTETQEVIPLDTDSTFIELHFGKNKDRLLRYIEFGQFLRHLHDEYVLEAFRRADVEGTGFISVDEFKEIITTINKHMLTPEVESRIIEVTSKSSALRKVSFQKYIAFNSMLENIELLKRIYLNYTKGNRNQALTKEEFMFSAQAMSKVTPLEIDILFRLAESFHHIGGRLTYKELKLIAPGQYLKRATNALIKIKAVESPDDRSIFIQLLENLYRFVLAGVSGAIAATLVYPIDLAKTRIQNQRITQFGELMYTGYLDCFKKILKLEGFIGLYKGLATQLCGATPENAVQITTNDFVRDLFYDKQGNIPLHGEVIAGCLSGFTQALVSNPLEAVKIRQQIAGEASRESEINATKIIKDLGIKGLYKGIVSCFIRDVTFSALYFTIYSNAKIALATSSGYNPPHTLFWAGIIAGVPSSFLVTPADVVKTRLQATPREGQQVYDRIRDTVHKIYRQEGFSAFWKGGLARVCRTTPQLAVAMFSYELLQRLFYIDFGGTRPTGSEQRQTVMLGKVIPPNPDQIGGYAVVLPILSGIESQFGIRLQSKPKTSLPKSSTEPVDL